jgi:microcystin-dependent protein
MAKPTNKPVIAESDVNLPNTGQPNKSQPVGSLLTVGYDKGQKPAAEEYNWLWDNNKEWIDYFEEKAFPTGGIIMWSGSIGSIPAGWFLCDGNNSTPNLQDRFIVGAGSTYAVDATGGATTDTSSSDGDHSHTITVNNHTLTESEMPSHTHDVTRVDATGGSSTLIGKTTSGLSTINEANAATSTGGSSGHNHTASSNSTGAHTHEVDILPPYYALAYIMKA